MSEEEYLSIFQFLGGRKGVRRLVDRFYDLMLTLPEAKDILVMHPEDLASSRDKFELFLCGWFGGPQLYMQKYGHPRLRARHLPFAIDSKARDAWMLCMRQSLQEQITDDDVRQQIEAVFARMANHMRNIEDPPD